MGRPLNLVAARKAVTVIVDLIDEYELGKQEQQERREEERVFAQWRAQLLARQNVESRREQPIAYEGFVIEGRRVRFITVTPPAAVQTGEIRRIETADLRRGRTVRGEVESVYDDGIILYLSDDPQDIPDHGRLLVDTVPARVKIDRERRALSALVHDGAEPLRRDLKSLILRPETSRAPTPVGISEWKTPELDASKQRAVLDALGAPDVFLVTGPPGTGKTTFIAELVAQELLRKPDALILISSQTHVALDNALSRIYELGPETRIVRLSDARGSKVSHDAERFTLERQIERWTAATAERSQAFLEEWCKQHGASYERVRSAMDLLELAEVRRRVSSLGDELEAIRSESTRRVEALTASPDDVSPEEIEERIEQLEERWQSARRDDQRIVRRIGKVMASLGIESNASPDTLVSASEQAGESTGAPSGTLQRLVALQAEWLQRLGSTDEFIEALLLGSQVIGGTCVGLARYRALANAELDLCVIDECSKATATETLVPMIRARRWVLVGDERQLPPFIENALQTPEIVEEHGLDPAELRCTLFDRFSQGLPLTCRTMLTTQHRMTKAIGDLISTCFYEGQLESHGPPPLRSMPGILPKPVTWWDTRSLPDRHEREDFVSNRSFVNLAEARSIIRLIRQLDQSIDSNATKHRVLLLAPYSAQVRQLERRLDAIREDLKNLDVEANTVDAVQGREADLVFFSVTRSNPDSRAGFLKVEARANVALSRAQRGLIIVGDASFCQESDTSFASVVRYIGANPDTCAHVELPR